MGRKLKNEVGRKLTGYSRMNPYDRHIIPAPVMAIMTPAKILELSIKQREQLHTYPGFEQVMHQASNHVKALRLSLNQREQLQTYSGNDEKNPITLLPKLKIN